MMADLWALILGLVRGAFILGAAWWVGSWLRTVALAWLESRIDPTWRSILGQAVRLFPVLVVMQTVLEGIGIPATSWVAALSTAGLAVAISLKDSLSNAASGAILLTTAPFRVGDTVTIAGVAGIVRRVGFITTEIDTDDGRRITVTNDRVLAANIERHAVGGLVRFELSVRVPSAHLDHALLTALVAAAAEATPGAPAPDVLPVELDSSLGTRLLVRAWARPGDLLATRAAVATAVARVVEASGAPPTPATR